MAGKRKVHIRTDLTVPMVGNRQDSTDDTGTFRPAQAPEVTLIRFPHSAVGRRTYDFAPHYGVGIDEITYACQRQLERFLARQDAEVETSTIIGYARGLHVFLPYLSLRAMALQRRLTLADIDRGTIDGYLRHLVDSGVTKPSQKARYDFTKSVLVALGRRGLIRVIPSGEERTFPANPFPKIAQSLKGEKPLSRRERQAFAAAVKTAVMPIFRDDVEVTSTLLAYALLIVALHTGRNTTPLLEMRVDCLRPHPKENTHFLVLWKRRGHNTSKVALRGDSSADRTIEALPSVKVPVVRLINRVIELTAPLQTEVAPHLSGRVWLYRSRRKQEYGSVAALADSTIGIAISELAANSKLVDVDGEPLRINISRLRKTFANRIFEILDGDLGSTAIALGNTPEVASRNYLRPDENSKRNWKFLGEVLTKELLTRTIGATERTPTGRCTDSTGGQYAPKRRDGTTCFAFLDCLRCRNYVVTADDLYRLFSFYWRVLRERASMDAGLWERHYAHIPRLIDRDVIEAGIQRRIFTLAEVDKARNRARNDPHPFWKFDSVASLDTFRLPQVEDV